EQGFGGLGRVGAHRRQVHRRRWGPFGPRPFYAHVVNGGCGRNLAVRFRCGLIGSEAMDALRFDNAFLRELPGDPETGPRLRQVSGAAWSRVDPTPVAAPRLVAHSPEMARALGFSQADVASAEFARVFAGNALLPGMEPFASNYGGHQFGHWAGQLGDGRAIGLGEAGTAG